MDRHPATRVVAAMAPAARRDSKRTMILTVVPKAPTKYPGFQSVM
jgi:hypothetical protein